MCVPVCVPVCVYMWYLVNEFPLLLLRTSHTVNVLCTHKKPPPCVTQHITSPPMSQHVSCTHLSTYPSSPAMASSPSRRSRMYTNAKPGCWWRIQNVQGRVAWCRVVWCRVVWCRVMLCRVMWCGKMVRLIGGDEIGRPSVTNGCG